LGGGEERSYLDEFDVLVDGGEEGISNTIKRESNTVGEKAEVFNGRKKGLSIKSDRSGVN